MPLENPPRSPPPLEAQAVASRCAKPTFEPPRWNEAPSRPDDHHGPTPEPRPAPNDNDLLLPFIFQGPLNRNKAEDQRAFPNSKSRCGGRELTVRRCLADAEGRGPFRSEPYCFLLPDTPYEWGMMEVSIRGPVWRGPCDCLMSPRCPFTPDCLPYRPVGQGAGVVTMRIRLSASS